MKMELRSRALLKSAIESCGFLVMLTGHHHDAFADSAPVSARGVHWNLAERCCASTFVYDKKPEPWSDAEYAHATRNGQAPFSPNELFKHEIIREDGGRIVWRTQAYRRRDRRGFAPWDRDYPDIQLVPTPWQ